MVYALKYAFLDNCLDWPRTKKAAKLKMYNILQVLGIAKTIYKVTLKKMYLYRWTFIQLFAQM